MCNGNSNSDSKRHTHTHTTFWMEGTVSEIYMQEKAMSTERTQAKQLPAQLALQFERYCTG